MKMKFLIGLFSALLLTTAIYAQIPTDYYKTAESKSGTELQATLHDIIDNHTVISYDALWNAFKSTDKKSNGFVWDMYSDKPNSTPDYEFTFSTQQCGNYSGEGDCYNREHSFPKSWFNEQSPMYSDLFHLYPTDGYVNNRRGNYPLGQVTAPTWTSTNGSKLGNNSSEGYTGVVFEPIDEFKGDFARTYFYMATRYYGEDSNWPGSDMCQGSQLKEWALNLLLKWNELDPVSSKETERNNAVYAIQKNRNPFIDHPDYASLIWTNDQPTTEPTNHVIDFNNASIITLTWDGATGTTLPNGYLVVYSTAGFNAIATPVDGVAPENYTQAKKVPATTSSCTIDHLQPQTEYFIKIYPFTGEGNLTNYKTDGEVPQTSLTTE